MGSPGAGAGLSCSSQVVDCLTNRGLKNKNIYLSHIKVQEEGGKRVDSAAQLCYSLVIFRFLPSFCSVFVNILALWPRLIAS